MKGGGVALMSASCLPSPLVIGSAVGNVRVYEKPPCAVLVRGVPFPCPHRDENGDYVEHLSYHVTHARASRQEYERVAEWLEWGFWSDAAVRHTAETERRLVMAVLG
jgi:hypothetical protein